MGAVRVDTSDLFSELSWGSSRGREAWLAEFSLGGVTDECGELDVGEALVGGSKSGVE